MRKFLPLLIIFLTACGDPDFQSLDGKEGNFSDLRGQWLIINYWASWCKPCRIEIPELNRLAADHPQLTVFAVNFDQLAGDELSSQADAMGIEFTVLRQDPANLLGYARPSRLPTTILIDPAGQVAHILEGLQTEHGLLQTIKTSP
jgi:thiol-disulfide isomerase/thioredoxin